MVLQGRARGCGMLRGKPRGAGAVATTLDGRGFSLKPNARSTTGNKNVNFLRCVEYGVSVSVIVRSGFELGFDGRHQTIYFSACMYARPLDRDSTPNEGLGPIFNNTTFFFFRRRRFLLSMSKKTSPSTSIRP
ncbi:unnamed protein product [Ectocarpus sp. 6 AP-2014]